MKSDKETLDYDRDDDDMQQNIEEQAALDAPVESLSAVPVLDAESELLRMHAWEKRLLKQRSVVSMAQTQVDILTEKSKYARKDLEMVTARLLDIIDEIEQPPLFAEPAADASAKDEDEE